MTTIFLVRHSKPLKVNYQYTKDSLQIQNEKQILSLEGEQIAKAHFNSNIFDDIDCVYSSNYIRAIGAAKYIAEKNNLEINIVDDLGERKFGISSWDELPINFEKKQFLDENYKIGNGENLKEVRSRMYSSIIKILNENKNKKIVIVSHSTAILCLLKKWCDIIIVNDTLECNYKGENILNDSINYCETFKLDFDNNNNLVNIQRIKEVDKIC